MESLTNSLGKQVKSNTGTFELSSSPARLFAYVLLLLVAAHCLQQRFSLLHLLRIIIWNTFVYAVPSSLVTALDGRAATSLQEKTERAGFSHSRVFAAKSEAMRRILRLDGTGLLTKLQRATTSSGMVAVLKGQPLARPGLGNLDNSCYQNSVIQGLASLTRLPGFLQAASSNGDEEDRHRDISMTVALAGIISELNDPESTGQVLWTPAVLKNMSSWTQQDAQEYFSKIIDDLEKEAARNLKKVKTEKGLSQFATTKGTSKNELPVGNLASGVVQNPLDGLLAQRVGCLQCGYVEGLSLIPFNCITLPLETAMRLSYRIEDCLDSYTELEKIEGVDCGRCTLLQQKEQLARLLSNKRLPGTESFYESARARFAAVTEALRVADFSENTIGKKCQVSKKNRVSSVKSRQAVIARCPDSLVLHVNRSVFDENTFTMTKNNARVSFPEHLNISAWCLGKVCNERHDETQGWSTDPNVSLLAGSSQQSATSAGSDYDLRSIIVHQGRHENGHYVCYRRDPSNPKSWSRFSDETVHTVSQEQVFSADGVYMLFYDRILWEGDVRAGVSRAVGPFVPTAQHQAFADQVATGIDERSGDENADQCCDVLATGSAQLEIDSSQLAKADKVLLSITSHVCQTMEDTPARIVDLPSSPHASSTIDEANPSNEAKLVAPPMRTAGARKKRSRKGKNRGMQGVANMVAAN